MRTKNQQGEKLLKGPSGCLMVFLKPCAALPKQLVSETPMSTFIPKERRADFLWMVGGQRRRRD